LGLNKSRLVFVPLQLVALKYFETILGRSIVMKKIEMKWQSRAS
jgi:hypothetical protein